MKSLSPTDAPETSKPEWLTVQAAVDALTYADERDVLRRAFALKRAAQSEPDELKRTRHRLELLENELKALAGTWPEAHAAAARASLGLARTVASERPARPTMTSRRAMFMMVLPLS